MTVDGYCAAANCVYEFHGCYYHSCPAHYESSSYTPHRVRKTTNNKGETTYEHLKFGNLLSDTITKTETIRDSGYHVIEMWECKWDTICKKFDLPTSKKELEHIKGLIP